MLFHHERSADSVYMNSPVIEIAARGWVYFANDDLRRAANSSGSEARRHLANARANLVRAIEKIDDLERFALLDSVEPHKQPKHSN